VRVGSVQPPVCHARRDERRKFLLERLESLVEHPANTAALGLADHQAPNRDDLRSARKAKEGFAELPQPRIQILPLGM
jgi:hypothetical protein